MSQISQEEYSNAMNFLGQNLYNALTQSIEQLEPAFRTQQMVSNALSAFLVNIVYQQSKGNRAQCEQHMGELIKLMQKQIESIPNA